MSKSETDKIYTEEERDRIEGDYTSHRLFELRLSPVNGNFDAAHLKEINRRIFQDMPSLGFKDVTPGEYRPPIPEGDWMKKRGLYTVEGAFYAAYSPMDESAQSRLNAALKRADPNKLSGLNTADFTVAIGKLYTELDYIHPFSDGNSRTLREFTRQLSEESGYELDWNRFNVSAAGRDALYIARDLSVNTLATPHIRLEQSMLKVIYSMDRLEKARDLPNLLQDAIRPNRARVLKATIPDSTQNRLNKDETRDLSSNREIEKSAHKVVSQKNSSQGPEQER